MVLSVVVAPAVVLAANWCWQVWRKPAEIVGLLDVWNYKTPRELWTAYGPVFKEKSTSIMTPELLAALAHVETGGNPIARTYWKWSWSADWDRVFAPGSSAAGMFQITDGTLKEAENFCVKDRRVFRDRGRRGECAHKVAVSRLFPTDAVEMTAGRLHWEAERSAAEVYSRKRARNRDQDHHAFMAVTTRVENSIRITEGIINEVRSKYRMKKPIYIAFDEYNVWYRVFNEGKLEERYNMKDALVVALYLNVFVRNAHIVKMANMAQLVNVIAPMMITNGKLWKQPIYYPLQLFAQNSQGHALSTWVSCDTYDAGEMRGVPFLDVTSVHNTKTGELVLNVVNRHIIRMPFILAPTTRPNPKPRSSTRSRISTMKFGKSTSCSRFGIT